MKAGAREHKAELSPCGPLHPAVDGNQDLTGPRVFALGMCALVGSLGKGIVPSSRAEGCWMIMAEKGLLEEVEGLDYLPIKWVYFPP